MADIKALQTERTSLHEDIYESRVPKRVPVDLFFPFEFVAQFGGFYGTDLAEAQWNPSLLEASADKFCQTVYSDVCPFSGCARYPSYYQVLGCRSFVMGSSGFIQHPEVMGMLPEDYDYLTAKPFDCLVERVIPRQYQSLNLTDQVEMALSMTQGLMGFGEDFAQAAMIVAKLNDKYGYYCGLTPAASGYTAAPFDFLSDQLRGFKGISMDVRRMPEKVAEACEALYPIVLKMGMPAAPGKYSTVGMPLHMPTFMREKDFANLWWPTFKRMVDEYASRGVHVDLFCEDDWTRYLDYLAELPTNTIIGFEYGDFRLIKEKLGKKHILKGLFPVTMLKNHTKEQCLAKAREMIDILAPGGKYVFSPDKYPLAMSDVNLDNYCAVAELIRDEGVYSNAGETSGLVFNRNDYKEDPSAFKKIDSKYLKDWEQLESQNPMMSAYGIRRLQGFQDRMFQYLLHLLV